MIILLRIVYIQNICFENLIDFKMVHFISTLNFAFESLQTDNFMSYLQIMFATQNFLHAINKNFIFFVVVEIFMCASSKHIFISKQYVFTFITCHTSVCKALILQKMQTCYVISFLRPFWECDNDQMNW